MTLTVKDYEDRYDVADDAWKKNPNLKTAEALDRAKSGLWRARNSHQGEPMTTTTHEQTIKRLRLAVAQALDAFEDYTASGQRPNDWPPVYAAMQALGAAFEESR